MFWITICSKAALMAGTGLVLAALVLTVPNVRQVSSIYMACFLSVVGSCVFPAWLFLGLECVKPSAIAMGAARLLTVPLLLVFVRQPEHYIRAAAIQSSVELTATLLIIPYLVKRVRLRWYRPSLPEIVASLRTGWPLFMSGSVLLLCNSSAAVILGITAGKEQVGYYAAAEKLVKAAIAAISPAAQALYPHISGAKVESKGVALRLIRNSFWSIGGLALVVSIATFVCARPVSMLVLGAAFAPSVRLLQFMSPLPFLFAVMSVLGTQTMVVFEMDRLMSRIMIGAACGGIPLTFLLTLYLGAVGTANAAVLVAMVIVTAMIVSLRRKRLAIWRSPCASECLPAGSS